MSDDATIDKIRSVEEIVKLGEIGKAHRSPVLYRGQNDAWPLVPKILRPWDKTRNAIPAALKREDWLLTEFKRQAVGMQAMPADECDVASIAQHHGLPTRLLDWTQNPIAALWFAVDGRKDLQRPVIFRFETDEDDFGHDEHFMKPSKTIVFRPNHVSGRIRVQSGWFTVHHIEEGSTYPFDKLKHYKTRIRKFSVSVSTRLQWQLNDMGINRATLFPDMGNLCEHLAWESGWIDRAHNAASKSGFVAGPPR
jgi:FRG domain